MPSLQKTKSSSQLSGTHFWWPKLLFMITGSWRPSLLKPWEIVVLTCWSSFCPEPVVADENLAWAVPYPDRILTFRSAAYVFKSLSGTLRWTGWDKPMFEILQERGINKKLFIFFILNLSFHLFQQFPKARALNIQSKTIVNMRLN